MGLGKSGYKGCCYKLQRQHAGGGELKKHRRCFKKASKSVWRFKRPTFQCAGLSIQVPWEWNDTSVSFRDNICVHELFEKQVAAAPAATCLAFEGTFMTFATVNSKANQLARHLCTLGVGRDMPVGVLMERSFDLIIAIIGT